MLIRLHQINLERDERNDDLIIDSDAILISLMMACMHLVLEMFKLKLEAKCLRTNFLRYFVACHNAKQGWIPDRSLIFS